MRDWFRVNVEQPLNRLPIAWDIFFLYSCTFFAIGTILSGGR